ncbi:MAG: hypothetical protein AAGU78_04245 [Chloroflexota bacterium]
MGRRDPRPRRDDDREELDERVIDITRVAKVVKGGRRFAFRAVVVVGDNNGRVGIGIGKARGVPDSIRKASDRARRNMVSVALMDTTVPHEITSQRGGAVVLFVVKLIERLFHQLFGILYRKRAVFDLLDDLKLRLFVAQL